MIEYDQQKISLKELLKQLLLAEKELPVVISSNLSASLVSDRFT